MWRRGRAMRRQIQALTGFCLNWHGGKAIKLAMRRWGVPILSVALLALAPDAGAQSERDALIARHSGANGVPESLVRRVIHIESRGNPRIVSKGNYGLMQIRLGTARAMGYSGTAEGLLDPDTNMTYAVKYLAGAYRAAGCNADRAVSYYQRGYYKKPVAKCGLPQPSPTLVARAETNALARPVDRFGRKPAPARPVLESAAIQSTDVLRPKVVQTLLISRPKPTTASGKANAKLTPVAVPTPPMRPADTRLLSPEPFSKQSPEPTSPQAVAKLEPEAVPLPPVANRDLISASKMTVSPSRHRRARTDKKADTPVNLLSFLKKLVTPETKQRGRRHAARAQR